MKGKNELVLCTSELLVAVQEYLDKRMGEYAPLAIDVVPNKDYASNTFNIKLEGKLSVTPSSIQYRTGGPT